MCFCATASFAAAGGLALVGTALLARRPPRSELPLALVPFGYAIQQSIEGLLWHSLRGDARFVMPLTLAYLFFAAFWWPFYLPFTAWCAEPPGNRIRRRLLGGATLSGFLVGAFLYRAYLLEPTPAAIVGDSISHTTPPWVGISFGYFYVFLTASAGLFSSRRILQVYCALGVLFLLVAGWLYPKTLFSVWCFFAAVLSSLLLFSRRPAAAAAS